MLGQLAGHVRMCQKLEHYDFLRHNKCDNFQTLHNLNFEVTVVEQFEQKNLYSNLIKVKLCMIVDYIQ